MSSLPFTPRADTPNLIIGLMSGTSLDGVDAALVEFDAARMVLRGSHYLPYPDHLRQALLALHNPANDELAHAARIAQELARLYADAVAQLLQRTQTPAAEVTAIGCHGQTIRHAPQQGYSLQLNQPALLAELSGISVVADFRARDIAAGGQGAPLVPAFHAARFMHPQTSRAILNIGGIANLTVLAPHAPIRGFDTGPGNMLLDAWIQHCQEQRYDAGGHWAAQGQVHRRLHERLMAHPYLQQRPPKSCGREQFNLAWLEAELTALNADLAEPLAAVDVQATLLALTADSIALAMQHDCAEITELYVCGGGAHNQQLLKRLAERMPRVQVQTTATLGLDVDWVEAVAFAWLAWRTWQGLPGNLPAVTGAQGARILGAIYPA